MKLRWLILVLVTLGWAAGTSASAAAGTVVVAAGDIACDAGFDWDRMLGGCQGAQTAALVAGIRPQAVLLLGDEQYPDATSAEFARGFDRTWGRFKAISYPAPGNHEYEHDRAAGGYFSYFGKRAGPAREGWYSFDLGGWHLIALNGNCALAGGCGHGSPQERWLRADLRAHAAACTLAYWHQPRFSSGGHHSDAAYEPLWEALYAARADLVLNGHDHDYERFAPQRPDGRADPARGIVEFVAGTGGKSHNVLMRRVPNSAVRNQTAFGVLELTLARAGYAWRFLAVPAGRVLDAGSAACHRK